MADITIDAAALLPTSRGFRAMVFASASVGYFFFIDADSDFKYAKTTDGGATWGGLTTVYIGTVVAFDVWFDKWTPGDSGTKIHLWYIESDTHDVRYRSLDTSGDSLNTEVVVFDGASAASATATFVSGAKMRGGNLMCCFDIDAGVEQGTYRSTDGGANWGSRATFMESNLDKALLFPGNESDNQDCYCIFMDASANDLSLKVYDDSANTVGETLILAINTYIDNVTDGIGQNGFAAAVRHSDNHLIVAAFNARDTAGEDFLVYDIGSAASIVQKTNITTNIDDMYYPWVFINQANDAIYVAYIGKRDGSETLDTTAGVFYTKSTDGGANWSAGDTVYSATSSDWRNMWGTISGSRFMVAWRDISSQALLTNFDNSLDLTPGGGPTAFPWPYYQQMYAMQS